MEVLKSNPNARILITTYTDNNEQELKQRFLKLYKYVPKNITIQTWLSFLFNHGARPYKFSAFQSEIIIDGILPPDEKKTVFYYNKNQKEFYLRGNRFYKDGISPFVLRCNQESNGAVIERLEEIYTHIFIDEVQDLAGNDLDFLEILLKSQIQILAVGDIRQHTYSTNDSNKNSGYSNIKEFVMQKCQNIIEIDEHTLQVSHRNNKEICKFANKLYPSLESTKPCECCEKEVNHVGLFIIKEDDKDAYLNQYNCVQLRWDRKCKKVNKEYEVYNFGDCKGMTFNRILIYPTEPIKKYLINAELTKIDKIKKGKLKGSEQKVDAFDIAKFYVAVTRARYSVCIVIDDSYFDNNFIEGVSKYSITPPHTPPQEP
jgi:DNA helicase-2/ATP-dependent DNA helicase PcrA